MKNKKLLSGIVAVGLVASLAACSGGGRGADAGSGDSGGDNSGALVGVAMPTKVSERWIKDGDAVKSALEDKGYKGRPRVRRQQDPPSRSSRSAT